MSKFSNCAIANVAASAAAAITAACVANTFKKKRVKLQVNVLASTQLDGVCGF